MLAGMVQVQSDRRKSKVVALPTVKLCTDCGEYKPISEMEPGIPVCKACVDAQRQLEEEEERRPRRKQTGRPVVVVDAKSGFRWHGRVKGIAEHFGVSPTTIRYYIKTGRLWEKEGVYIRYYTDEELQK